MEIINYENSFWKNKKVYITGHTGFKGSWLSALLLNLGAQVKGYSLEPINKNDHFNLILSNLKADYKNQFLHKLGDIKDLESLKKSIQEFEPDFIFHLAAQSLVITGYEKPIETWETNVIGTLNLLESCKKLKKKCAVVCITTDKVYKNKEWEFGYRENDDLGGYDPYSASKASAELLIDSWRNSFVKNKLLKIATARAGNVIGGGDWAKNRLVPDIYKSIYSNEPISLRNAKSKRPWQHVLEPLTGYLSLAKYLYIKQNPVCEGFNFGPGILNNKTVFELTASLLNLWPNYKNSIIKEVSSEFHETSLLHLNIDKAQKILDWSPALNFEQNIKLTSDWYFNFYEGISAYECTKNNIKAFFSMKK